jgi:hypothetical protein
MGLLRIDNKYNLQINTFVLRIGFNL